MNQRSKLSGVEMGGRREIGRPSQENSISFFFSVSGGAQGGLKFFMKNERERESKSKIANSLMIIPHT